MALRGAILAAAAVALLSGCSSTTSTPGPRPAQPTPPRTACDAATLQAALGRGTPELSACDARTLVEILGGDVRRAKVDCRTFEALGSDWSQRMANWDLLAANIATTASTKDNRDSATLIRQDVTAMRDSSTLRRVRLNSLLDRVVALEKAEGAPSPPVGECQ